MVPSDSSQPEGSWDKRLDFYPGNEYSSTYCVLAACLVTGASEDTLLLHAVRGTVPVRCFLGNGGPPSLGTKLHLKGSGVVPPLQDQVRKKRGDIIFHG